MIKTRSDYIGVRLLFPFPGGVVKKDPDKNPNILSLPGVMDTLYMVNMSGILDYIYSIGCYKLVQERLSVWYDFAVVRA